MKAVTQAFVISVIIASALCGKDISGQQRLSKDSSLLLGDKSAAESPNQGTYYCFEDKCRCKGHVADCSKNDGRLTFVPKLPAEITTLDFSSNGLTAIPSDNFFANITNVSSLDLSHNRLRYVSYGAFRLLRNLSEFVCNENNVVYFTGVEALYAVRTLTQLEIVKGQLDRVPKIENWMHLETLNLRENLFHFVTKLTYFAQLKSLISLNLGNTRVVQTTLGVLSIQELHLDLNEHSDFPETCNGQASYFPYLEYLNLKYNDIEKLTGHICLPKLRFLDLSGNVFEELLTDSFSFRKFPSLLDLHLNDQGLDLTQIESFAFNNSALQSIYLESNSIHTITADMLAGLPALRRLDLSHNWLAEIPDQCFEELPNLTHLDISSNGLSKLSENVFSEITRNRLIQFSGAGNIFGCDCNLMWFGHWMASRPSVFNSSDYKSQTCRNYNRFLGKTTDISLIELGQADKQACLISYQAAFFIILSLSIFLFVFAFVLALVSYRNASQQQSQYFMLPFRILKNKIQGLAQRRNEMFTYDVFVSYAEEDSDLVLNHLKPRLEDRHRLRLCLHQRDFHPGKNILVNIEDCVVKSNKVMMIFSPHFARSPWCQFELSLCQRHVMDRYDQLVVIHVRNTPVSDLTASMAAILRTCTYIPWSEEEGEGRDMFWNGLYVALADVLHPPPPHQDQQQHEHEHEQQQQQQHEDQRRQQWRQRLQPNHANARVEEIEIV